MHFFFTITRHHRLTPFSPHGHILDSFLVPFKCVLIQPLRILQIVNPQFYLEDDRQVLKSSFVIHSQRACLLQWWRFLRARILYWYQPLNLVHLWYNQPFSISIFCWKPITGETFLLFSQAVWLSYKRKLLYHAYFPFFSFKIPKCLFVQPVW